MIKIRALLASLILSAPMFPAPALSQSSPNLITGQVPTAAQWNSYFARKQDVLNFVPLNVAGGVMTGKLTTTPSSATSSGFNVMPGVAPAAPNNGDIWATSSGLFVRVSGTTVGPLASAAGGSFTATSPVAVTFPGGATTNYALNFNSTLTATGGNLGINLSTPNTWSGAQTFVAPNLGTPASGTLTFATGLPVATGISGLGTGVASFLGAPSSANLAAAVTDETGSGSLVFGTSPSIASPALSGTVTGTYTLGGTPSISGASINSGLVGGTYGGTGVNNGARTITIGGNLSASSTVSITGAFSTAAAFTQSGGFSTTLTSTATTNATLPAGTQTLAALGVPQTWTATQTFPNNSLTLAQFPTIGANTVIGSIAGGTPAALTTTQLTTLCNVFTATLNGCVTSPGTPTGRILSDNGTWITVSGSGSVTSVGSGNGLSSTTNPIVASGTINVEQMTPGGRLTLGLSTPYMSASQTNQTNIYFAPIGGGSRYIPLYTSGVGMRLLPFTSSDTDTVGLSVAMGGNAAWPANANIDAYAYVNGSAAGMCTAPDWSQGAVAGSNAVGSSARGTGAGSAEQQMFRGFTTNKVTMTCRTAAATTVSCAPNECTFLGFFRTTTAGTTTFTYGAAGVAATLYVWNAFNPKNICTNQNFGSNWSYTAAVIRQANASSINQINFISGGNGSVTTWWGALGNLNNAIGASYRWGPGLNSTTTYDRFTSMNNVAAQTQTFNGTAMVAYNGVFGPNYISANESGDGTNPTLVVGDARMSFQACLDM